MSCKVGVRHVEFCNVRPTNKLADSVVSCTALAHFLAGLLDVDPLHQISEIAFVFALAELSPVVERLRSVLDRRLRVQLRNRTESKQQFGFVDGDVRSYVE